MKRSIIYIFMIVVSAMAYNDLHAQDKLMFKIGYNTGMPVGSFKDYMSKNSFRGYRGEILYPVTEQLKVGLGVSFNDYYEKIPRQTYHTSQGTLSAVVSNSIQTTPIMIKGEYELMKTGWIRPYAGFGAGFDLVTYARYFGEFGDKKTAFKPAVGAEAGVNIPFNRETRASGINVGGHFNYLPFKYNELTNLNNWGLHVAAYFPLR
jgi:opacity protein-like surface antigen